jgi:ATP-binding cassette, subfamily C, bacterial LapB
MSGAAAAKSLEAPVLAYLKHLGQPVSSAELWAGLPRSADGVMDFALAGRALDRLGYDIWRQAKVGLDDLVLPCLLRLKGGDLVFVASRAGDGDTFTVYDDETDVFTTISTAVLAAHCTGEMVKLTPKLDALQTRHVGARPKGHWFWGHFGPLRAQIWDVILASGFANILAVTIALFALQVYDRVVPNQNTATLWVLVGGVMLAIVMEFLLRVARARLIDKAGQGIEIAVNRDLFERLINTRLDSRTMPAGSAVNAMREFASVKEFFAVSAAGVVTDLPFVFIFLLVIYAIAGPVVIVVALGAVAMIVLGLVFQRRIYALSRDMLGGTTASLRILTEISYGMETIRSHNAAPWFQRNWEEVIALNAQQSSDHRRLSAALSFGAGALQMLTYVGAVTAGVYLFFANQLSVGGIIAVSILTSRTLAPIVQLSAVISRWQNTAASLDALEAIANAPQERDAGRSFIRRKDIRGALHLRDIRTAYPRVEGVQLVIPDLAIAPGTRLAVLGENGSGKSLLLRVMAGLYAPNQGTYLIDGVEARQIDPFDLRRAVAYLPQDPRLFKGTLRDNLAVGETVYSDDRLFEALDFAGLRKAVSATTLGLDLEIKDGGEGLSVGQRAAVGLARIHLQDPALVLLDEPTAAMDSRAELEFVARFGDWLKGRSAIICTHRMPVLEVLNDVVVLSEGRILAKGPKADILAQFTRRAGSAAPQAVTGAAS